MDFGEYWFFSEEDYDKFWVFFFNLEDIFVR